MGRQRELAMYHRRAPPLIHPTVVKSRSRSPVEMEMLGIPTHQRENAVRTGPRGKMMAKTFQNLIKRHSDRALTPPLLQHSYGYAWPGQQSPFCIHTRQTRRLRDETVHIPNFIDGYPQLHRWLSPIRTSHIPNHGAIVHVGQ